MKLSVTDELKVGALTIIAIAVFVIGFSYLKGATLFARDQKIYVLLEDAASVSPASPVAMHGIKIGKVKDVVQEKNDSFNVVFSLSINKDVKIPAKSIVQIVELDLLGSKELRVTPSDAGNYLQSGDTIIGYVQGGMMAMITEQLDDKLGPLMESTVPLINRMDTLVMNLNTSLMEGGEGSLDDMLGSLRRSLNNVEGITRKVDALITNQTENIDGIFSSANKLTTSLADNSGKIDSIISNFNMLSGKLSVLEFENIVNSANNIVDDIEALTASLKNADGTLGKLLNEDGIYVGLDSTLSSLNALLVDVKANPKKYVSFSLIGRK
ncbi:MAG: MCE family protein [Bacteroidetes bacterium]|nr:MCE family protein [Bacteroidota bacterium]